MKIKYTTPKVVLEWKDFPLEIRENVWARLHFRDLCRSRLVCKEWNDLITQPSFRSLRASTPRQASFILISPASIFIRLNVWDEFLPHTYWEIFEMAEKRLSYIVNDPFCVVDRSNRFLTEYTLAADRGLIYIMNETPTGVRHHIVRNLVTKSFYLITEPDVRFSYEDDIVVMAEDRATGSFKIITVEARTSDMSRREGVFVYASTTKEWRWLCEVPGVNHAHRAISSIFVKGLFFILFYDMTMVPWCPELYSCDLETGAWSYIDVKLPRPSHSQETLQLVTSLGRLFLVEYTGLPNRLMDLYQTPSVGQYFINKKFQIQVTIWEILITEKKVIKMAKMPKFSKYPTRMLRASLEGRYVNPLAVVGCEEYVVILTQLGRHVGWNLLRNCWDELPANAVHFDSTYCRGIFAGLVDF